MVRINSTFFGEVTSAKEQLSLEGYYADGNFFSVFSFEMLHGNANTALARPNNLVLTESAALKIFSTTDVLSKTIEFKDIGLFEISGIMKDPPVNTHMEFEALVSYSSLPSIVQGDGTTRDQWIDYLSQYVYLFVTPDSDLDKIQLLLDNVANEIYTRNDEIKINFHLQALTDITPGIDLRNSIGPLWDNTGFIVFAAVCLLILLPACFNYTNISIAHALKRSKEIGIRKTMGGFKSQIFFQFITETVLITLVSLVGAFLLFVLVRSEFK